MTLQQKLHPKEETNKVWPKRGKLYLVLELELVLHKIKINQQMRDLRELKLQLHKEIQVLIQKVNRILEWDLPLRALNLQKTTWIMLKVMLVWEVMDHKLRPLMYHKLVKEECWKIQMWTPINQVAYLAQILVKIKIWIKFNNCIKIMF